MHLRILCFALTFTWSAVNNACAQVDSNFHCYLLFGQSNMAGGGAGVPIGGSGAGTLIPEDCDTSSRVKVLAFCNCDAGNYAACPGYTQSRTADRWYTARPALHICNEGVSPGDWFAKTLLDSVRDDIKIGLIPCALSGMSLEVFMKGESNFNIPGWAHPTLGNSSPYAWMLERCRIAQQTGVVKGILLHQGESGTGSRFPNLSWIKMAGMIFDSLKKDLQLDSRTPVAVGELRQGSFLNGDINSFANSYQNCGLASSLNLGVQSDDPWHFNPEGMRELGRRYALAFLSLADNTFIPRKGNVSVDSPENSKAFSASMFRSGMNEMKVFTINGKMVKSNKMRGNSNTSGLYSGNIYIVFINKCRDMRLMLAP